MMRSKAMRTLITMAMLGGMFRENEKVKTRCRTCCLLVDINDATPIRYTVKTGQVCSDRCLNIYRKEQEAQRQQDKIKKDKEIRANMKKYGGGFKR